MAIAKVHNCRVLILLSSLLAAVSVLSLQFRAQLHHLPVLIGIGVILFVGEAYGFEELVFCCYSGEDFAIYKRRLRGAGGRGLRAGLTPSGS